MEQEQLRNEWNSEQPVCDFIGALIKMTGARTTMEVGVFEGYTAKAMIEALPKGGQYIGVDITDYRTEANKKAFDRKGVSTDFFIGSSLDVSNVLNKGHFDLIFIDGDHSWEYVIKEFKKMEQLISRGGLLVYHDTIHLDGPKRIVEYAHHYGYRNVTLNTPEVRGLSILHRV